MEPDQVNVRVAESQEETFLLIPLLAAQKGFDAREEFAVVKRFGQVIIRAGVQSPDSMLHFRLAREHEDGSGKVQPPQFGAHRDTIQPRQHDVEDHQIDARVERPLESAASLMLALDGKAFALQELQHQGAELGVVVDQ